MRNAVIYARYSSDKQDEASIEAQVRACREYAVAKGYTVLEVYSDEAISGKGSKTASRKAYQRMLRNEKYTGTYTFTPREEERREDRRSKPNAIRIENATPPTDFTVDQIKAWLEVLKSSADEKAVHLLIERIDIVQGETKTDFNMQSTLKSVLGEIGCGGGGRT